MLVRNRADQHGPYRVAAPLHSRALHRTLVGILVYVRLREVARLRDGVRSLGRHRAWEDEPAPVLLRGRILLRFGLISFCMPLAMPDSTRLLSSMTGFEDNGVSTALSAFSFMAMTTYSNFFLMKPMVILFLMPGLQPCRVRDNALSVSVVMIHPSRSDLCKSAYLTDQSTTHL